MHDISFWSNNEIVKVHYIYGARLGFFKELRNNNNNIGLTNKSVTEMVIPQTV